MNSVSRLPLVMVGLLLAVGAVSFWFLVLRERDLSPAELTPEAKDYVRNLQLSGVQMKAAESYLKQAVVEIVGKIANAGDRTLRQVDLNCVFYDPYGQLVLRERVTIVKARTGGFKPGQAVGFRLPFDNIPESWNQAMPQLVIAHVRFQ